MLGALRRVARSGKWQQVRRMSSGVSREEEVKEMNKWRIVTYISIPVCIGKAFYDLSHAHPHVQENPGYPYLHVRTKDFPWGPNGLFEKEH